MAGRFEISRRSAIALGLGGAALAARPGWAFAAAEPEVDALVEGFRSEFGIPGVAVAIVRPNRPGFAAGYGVRTLGRGEPVDADTLFAIASNSKAMLAAVIAMLVEEGRLGWDKPVVKYMPDFAMSDPAATAMMTVRDLLVHRSGLALGAGDLMQFPLSDHTRADMVAGLRHLPLVRGFRSGYAYDNILYVVAGVLVERVTREAWEDVLTGRLLRPLGMRHAVAVRSLLPRGANVVARHARLGPPLRGMGPVEIVEPDESIAGSPAGGAHISANEALLWLGAQLGKGVAPNGRRLWSEASAAEMWTPQIVMNAGPGPTPDEPTRPLFSTYALGWVVQDFRGQRLVQHSGGLSGQVTYTALLPERGIGLAVFSNAEERALSGLRNALLDHLVDAPPFDWLAATRSREAERNAEAEAMLAGGDVAAPAGGPSLPLSAYVGRWRDAWYGDIVVAERAGALHIDFTRTPVFRSRLEPWGPDAFRTRFAKGAGEDAVVSFTVAGGAVTGMALKALSPFADFSYDFHDLKPVRVE
jgi:CubicO group peptidase (beta-lactamase class C family)